MFASFDRPRWQAAVKALRGTRTQGDVAKVLGLSVSQVSRFEGGENTVDWFATRLDAVAAAYGTTAERLHEAAGLREGPEPWHPAFPGVAREAVTVPVPLDGAPDGWGRTATEIAPGRGGTGWMWVVGPRGTGRTTAARQLATALGATLLLAEPAGGWAAFRFQNAGRFVAVAETVGDAGAQWMEEGRPHPIRLQPAAWSAVEWRALLSRLDAAGQVPGGRRAGAEALCERLGGEDLPWELGVQALADHLRGDGPPPDDVGQAVMDAALLRARAYMPTLRDEEIAAFWAARRIACPGDDWDAPTVAEAEALLPAVPDVEALRARVNTLREGRRGWEAQVDGLAALLVDPAARREAWERAGLLRRVEDHRPPVHPYTVGGARAAAAPTTRLAAPHADLARRWCARGLRRELAALAADTSWLLDPSWWRVLEAMGRLGDDPAPLIALLDGAGMPLDASRAIVLLASAHPAPERFPAERLVSAWAETLLAARLLRRRDLWDGGRHVERALWRLSGRARALLPVLHADATDALLARVRAGVDVDPYGLLPADEGEHELEGWMPGERWEGRRSFVCALAELAPWQLPLVNPLFPRGARPPEEELLAHGAARGLEEAVTALVYRMPVAVGAGWIRELPEEQRAEAFLYLWERAERGEGDALIAASAHVPGLAPLLRLVDHFGHSEVRRALQAGEAPERWLWRWEAAAPPWLLVALLHVATERAEAAGDTDDGAHLRRILRRIATRREPLEIRLAHGGASVDGQRVRVAPPGAEEGGFFFDSGEAVDVGIAVAAALQRRDAVRGEAARALHALGEDGPLRARAWNGVALDPADAPGLRRLFLWEQVRRADVSLLLRGGEVPDAVRAFLARAAGQGRLAQALEEGRRRDEQAPETVPDPWWWAAHLYLPRAMMDALAVLDRLGAPADHAARARRAVIVVLADTDCWPLDEPVPDAVAAWLVGASPEPAWVTASAFAAARASAARTLAEASDAEAIAHWVRGTQDPDDAVYAAVEAVMTTPARFEEAARLLEGPATRGRRYQLLAQAARHHLDAGELPAWLKTIARAELRLKPDTWPGWLPYSHQRDVWSLLRAYLRSIEDIDRRVREAIQWAHGVRSFNELVAEAVLDWCEEAPAPFAAGEDTYGVGRSPALWRKVLAHVQGWLGSGVAPLPEVGAALASLWEKAVLQPLAGGWDDAGLYLTDRCPELLATLAQLLARAGRGDVVLATFRAPPSTSDADAAALAEHPVALRGPWGEPFWCPLFAVPVRPLAGRGELLRTWLFDAVADALGAEARDWHADDALRERRFEQAWAEGDPALIDALFARLPEDPAHPQVHFAWYRAAGSRPAAALPRLVALWERTRDARWLDLVEETDLLWGPFQGRALAWARRARASTSCPSGKREASSVKWETEPPPSR